MAMDTGVLITTRLATFRCAFYLISSKILRLILVAFYLISSKILRLILVAILSAFSPSLVNSCLL